MVVSFHYIKRKSQPSVINALGSSSTCGSPSKAIVLGTVRARKAEAGTTRRKKSDAYLNIKSVVSFQKTAYISKYFVVQHV
jgi:hypothetical protein